MDHTRDPCPWVALNDFGGAFCMGVCSFFYSGPEGRKTDLCQTFQPCSFQKGELAANHVSVHRQLEEQYGMVLRAFEIHHMASGG